MRRQRGPRCLHGSQSVAHRRRLVTIAARPRATVARATAARATVARATAARATVAHPVIASMRCGRTALVVAEIGIGTVAAAQTFAAKREAWVALGIPWGPCCGKSRNGRRGWGRRGGLAGAAELEMDHSRRNSHRRETMSPHNNALGKEERYG